MHYLYGQNIPEIQEHTGFSEAKIRKTLLRMKNELKDSLQKG
jgi:DNA-directed RNA polymerase specialized sigma24 family protein